jgi:hypothetical protein
MIKQYGVEVRFPAGYEAKAAICAAAIRENYSQDCKEESTSSLFPEHPYIMLKFTYYGPEKKLHEFQDFWNHNIKGASKYFREFWGVKLFYGETMIYTATSIDEICQQYYADGFEMTLRSSYNKTYQAGIMREIRRGAVAYYPMKQFEGTWYHYQDAWNGVPAYDTEGDVIAFLKQFEVKS